MGNLKNLIRKIFMPSINSQYEFTLPIKSESDSDIENVENVGNIEKIFSNIASNLEYVKVQYKTLLNSDIVVREFLLNARNKKFKAFILFIDGMVNSALINDNILTPLMLRNRANTFEGTQNFIDYDQKTNNAIVRKIKKFDIKDYINTCLLPQNSVQIISDFSEVFDGVNSGNCVLFVDGLASAFDIEVKGFKQRGVESPNNEIVIRGAQQAFNESIRVNTSLVRRLVNNENLIIENIPVGNISKTKCAVCYINNIVNDNLVAEVKYRLNNINVDYVLSSGQLEQLIEDNGNYSVPELIATERPDRVAGYLLEGRVAIIVNGNPYVLIAPAIMLDFLSSPEDANLKFQYSNLLKFIRILALFLTLFLPALYIAITSFHQELIPTELLFAIVSSRESVPFPIIIELLIMEISFELIREGGLRIPSAIGPTIGIVGALILGQAAVEASIVSPILIIIVSITGLASFAIPDFSLSFHCRIVRFVYTFLGYLCGFLGIAMGFFIHLFILSSIESFGVAYLSPYIPFEEKYKKGLFVTPIWKREKRPDFLDAKKEKKQPNISMKWKYTK